MHEMSEMSECVDAVRGLYNDTHSEADDARNAMRKAVEAAEKAETFANLSEELYQQRKPSPIESSLAAFLTAATDLMSQLGPVVVEKVEWSRPTQKVWKELLSSLPEDKERRCEALVELLEKLQWK
jgi:hypothetical protein